jgi:cytochrome P450
MVLRYCPFAKVLGGGQARRQMPAGTVLYVALIGALFDAEITDADHFLPQRPTDEDNSLVFGWGQHHCLGRHVATAELVAMLRAFLSLRDIRQFRRSKIRYDGPAADRFVITRRVA